MSTEAQKKSQRKYDMTRKGPVPVRLTDDQLRLVKDRSLPGEGVATAIKRLAGITRNLIGDKTMENMSYCRFENTLADLRECYENMDEDDLSESEAKARTRLIQVCRDLADDYEDELEDA